MLDRLLTCTGLAPAATIFMPSAMIAALRMVAVVVPSPAVSLVFAAACGAMLRVHTEVPRCLATTKIMLEMT